MGDGWVAAYSTGNEPYGFRTPAVELETGERLVWLVELSPPPSIVEYSSFGNEGTMGLGVRLPLIRNSLDVYPPRQKIKFRSRIN